MSLPLFIEKDVDHDPVAFPKLTAAEVAAARRIGRVERYGPGQYLFEARQQGANFFVLVDGAIEVIDTSGDEERLVVEHRANGFIGDLNIFANRPASVTCRVSAPSEVIRLTNDNLRHLLACEASLGERLIEAFLRRRELLEESGFEGMRVFGDRKCPETQRIREFLHRNGVAYRWVDTGDPASGAVLASLDGGPYRFPLVAWSHKVLEERPSISDLADHVGVRCRIPDEIFDTVIIGSGPSGLGAAVYAASEGLHTLVLDRLGPGGQAGSSSRIENYAGFPAGLSGRELALRSYIQALKFGATFSSPCDVTEIRCLDGELHAIETDDGTVVRTKTVIISTGVTYRNLDVRGLRAFRDIGVYYSATQVEAMLCSDRPVHVIGAGNSAGQAAMYLSKFTKDVRLIVRGTDLQKSMSQYLADRVAVNPRIDIRLSTELRAIEGDRKLERITLEDTAKQKTYQEESCGIFIFIGATPCTDFLGDHFLRDDKGFLMTGMDVVAAGKWAPTDRSPCPLETSCAGVFAAGDCRSRTTKRVAFAVGDGALAVTCVHDFLGTYR